MRNLAGAYLRQGEHHGGCQRPNQANGPPAEGRRLEQSSCRAWRPHAPSSDVLRRRASGRAKYLARYGLRALGLAALGRLRNQGGGQLPGIFICSWVAVKAATPARSRRATAGPKGTERKRGTGNQDPDKDERGRRPRTQGPKPRGPRKTAIERREYIPFPNLYNSSAGANLQRAIKTPPTSSNHHVPLP